MPVGMNRKVVRDGLSHLLNTDLITVLWEQSMFSLFFSFNKRSPWDKIKAFAGKKTDGDPDSLCNIDGYSFVNICGMHSSSSQALFWATILFTLSPTGNSLFPLQDTSGKICL